MSEIVGLKIVDLSDGSAFVFNENTAPGSILFSDYVNSYRYNLTPDGGWLTYQYTLPNPIPTGYEVQFPGAGRAEVTFTESGDRRYVSGTQDLFNLNLSGDRKLTIKGLRQSRNSGEPNNHVQVFAYPTMEAMKTQGKAGLKIMGNNIFFNPIPSTGYAYAIHRKKIRINGMFRPSEIHPSLNMNNAVYFFYCEDAKSYITHFYVVNDKQTTYIDHYFVSRNRGDPTTTTRTSADYYVIAFANQSPADLEAIAGKAGLKLRDMNGRTTYCSAMKVLTRPYTIPANQINVNSGYTIKDVKRPMYCPSIYGETFTSNGGSAQFRSLNIGNFNGSTVGLFEVNTWAARGYHGNYTIARSSAPIIILDAADYFKF